MCSYSATMDHYHQRWYPNIDPWHPSITQPLPAPINPFPSPMPNPITPSLPTQIDINKFIEEVIKAKKIDDETGQKDCEKPELVDAMQKILDQFDKLHRKLDTILAPKPKKKARKVKKLTLLKG